jgi:hypothetical protein
MMIFLVFPHLLGVLCIVNLQKKNHFLILVMRRFFGIYRMMIFLGQFQKHFLSYHMVVQPYLHIYKDNSKDNYFILKSNYPPFLS